MNMKIKIVLNVFHISAKPMVCMDGERKDGWRRKRRFCKPNKGKIPADEKKKQHTTMAIVLIVYLLPLYIASLSVHMHTQYTVKMGCF